MICRILYLEVPMCSWGECCYAHWWKRYHLDGNNSGKRYGTQEEWKDGNQLSRLEMNFQCHVV